VSGIEVEKAHLARDHEEAKRAIEESRALQNEVTLMWQHMKRLEPNTRHAFGAMSTQLESQQGQPTTRLAPLHAPPPAHGNWGMDSTMQGVEYGSAYDRR